MLKYKQPHCVAFIPARGGSKRIPGKNTKVFCGKPILQYSIEVALKSELFTSVIVSTDDFAIADMAKAMGASVPFMRPKELSDDITPIYDVIKHAYEWYIENNSKPDFICYMYATAPFITVSSLHKGLSLLQEDSQADLCLPVTTFAFPIQRSLKIEKGELKPIFPEFFQMRSQDTIEAFHDVGQFYWSRPSRFHKKIFTELKVLPLRLDRSEVQDIDTLEDWSKAEQMYKIKHDGHKL